MFNQSLSSYARFFASVPARCLHLSTARSRFIHHNAEYNFLEQSYAPTYHFQDSLLRLPIPKLSNTCSRYLQAQKVLLKGSEYDETVKVVKEFESMDGVHLQTRLQAIDKANKHTSYISEPWFDMYLSDRAPVVLNYNPFLAFLSEQRKGYNDPVIRATNILISSMRFKNSLKYKILDPEVYHLNPAKSDTQFFRSLIRWMPGLIASPIAMAFKAFPLDMSQFENLFHSTRVPCLECDLLKKSDDTNHILVMKNGNFYVFDLHDNDGILHSPSHIHACLSYIYSELSAPPEYPVGVLTAENRDVWAMARLALMDEGNGSILRKIDSAAFNIVFDDVTLGGDPEKSYRTFLYGDGNNRWFDKSFSILMTSDGEAALNFEHSWGDGVAVMRYFNSVAAEIAQRPFVGPDDIPASINAANYVSKLEFDVPPSVQETIKKAQQSYKERTDALGVNIFESDVFGKQLCKTQGVSPDAMMQLGFQLAYYLQESCATATYESCSTAAFKHGRTETLRPATLETAAFCEAVTKPDGQRPAAAELLKALKECSTKHGQLTKEAAMGQGFDRHLFGMKQLTEPDNRPAIFDDPAYANINHNVLSTSTLPSNRISFGGFAPVVNDGYGVGYQIKDDSLGVVLSSYPPHRNGGEFVQCLDKAYKTIHSILTTKA